MNKQKTLLIFPPDSVGKSSQKKNKSHGHNVNSHFPERGA